MFIEDLYYSHHTCYTVLLYERSRSCGKKHGKIFVFIMENKYNDLTFFKINMSFLLTDSYLFIYLLSQGCVGRKRTKIQRKNNVTETKESREKYYY